ncbi:hypothetical protein T05_12945 [Trichinella murrelli]|uniref:Uncharacterized protein n=1 Tax=Trichinella murrelli TaxID=144512 RepID=A0A0V0T039_9BILA|nr:hypothetical protein T05_2087 [Trichinella murrelli]KRX32347.1 hypothetical protein T05_12945 [Trichinella murrelli]
MITIAFDITSLWYSKIEDVVDLQGQVRSNI